jgi:phosphosulfolactate phosphohydrolase-like enzyme
VAAGALCDLIWKQFERFKISDSAQIARQIYLAAQNDIEKSMQHSRNARRLLANPELRDDVQFCLRRDSLEITAELHGNAVTLSPSK